MWSVIARSMAASTTSVLVLPSQPKTRYAPNDTCGATPRTPPVAKSPFAPMMPATCVPWPLQSSGLASGAGVSCAAVEPAESYASPTKSYPHFTRELGNGVVPGVPVPPRSGWSMSMPVSMTPTLMPCPV